MLNPQVRKQQQQQEAAKRTVGGGRGNPLLDLLPAETAYELPGPLGSFTAGSFDTPYVDENVRISRGTFGGPLQELRVFERIGGGAKKVYATWQEEEDALAAAAAAGEDLPDSDDRWQEGGFEETEAMDFADDYYGEPDS